MAWYPGDLIPYLPVILGGLWVSIYISVVSFVVGSVLGLFAYLGKAGKSRVVSAISAAYIEVVRNVPLVDQPIYEFKTPPNLRTRCW